MSGNFGMGPEIVRDPRAFLTQKKTLERVITFALSFIAFCCIVSIVDVPGGCIFNHNSTCGFVKFVTLLGWLNCIVFIILDWHFPSPSGILDTTQKRRVAVMYEMVFSAVWSFFYFCMFCACVAGWRKMSNDPDTDEGQLGFGAGSAKAIISFGFFSIPLWGYHAYQAMLKFQSGNFALPQYDDESMAGAKPFASFPAPNVSQSNTFDAPSSTGAMRPADLTY